MTISTSVSFAQITRNNQAVDQTIENLVNIACTKDEEAPRPDRLELEKTTHLLFLFSLSMGDREVDEGDNPKD